jgi:hypothetical protein
MASRLAELTPASCSIQHQHMTFWDGTGGLAALEEFLLRHPIQESR